MEAVRTKSQLTLHPPSILRARHTLKLASRSIGFQNRYMVCAGANTMNPVWIFLQLGQSFPCHKQPRHCQLSHASLRIQFPETGNRTLNQTLQQVTIKPFFQWSHVPFSLAHIPPPVPPRVKADERWLGSQLSLQGNSFFYCVLISDSEWGCSSLPSIV